MGALHARLASLIDELSAATLSDSRSDRLVGQLIDITGELGQLQIPSYLGGIALNVADYESAVAKLVKLDCQN